MGRVSFETFHNVIDGKLVATKETRHGINPATQVALPPVPLSTPEDVDSAVSAAKRAARGWAKIHIDERRKRVSQLADALLAQKDDFTRMLILEGGKPFAVARDEVATTARMLKGASELPLTERVVEETDRRRVITRYLPVGVSVGIVPWNFPLSLTSFKIGPALVAGNPFILKSSPFTPYVGLKLVEMAQEFFPPGVLQVLSGDDRLGPWLTAHPDVDKVSFTGSTATGIRVMQSCAPTLKSVTLELGGNDPAIVCPDVDIPTVAAKVAMLSLYNSGQVCIAIKRIYVHSSIYDEFLAAMIHHFKSMVIGDGLNESTTLGPVQNAMQYDRIKQLVASIESENLKVACGQVQQAFSNESGYFVNPILVDNPPDSSRVVTEEAFGPVLPIMRWDSEEEVIQRANTCEDGLGASVWSKDLARADRIADQLEVGTIWINCHLQLQPDATFAGHKRSGVGAELGIDGLKAYCIPQTIFQDKVGASKL